MFKICDLYLNIRLQCSTFLLVDGFNINIQMLQVCFFYNYRIILRWVLGDGVGISVFYYHQEENTATLNGNIC